MLTRCKNHTIQAPLVNLTVRLQRDMCEDDGMDEIPIVCAIADFGTADYDVILPADVVKELQAVDVMVCTLENITKEVTVVPEEVQCDSYVDPDNQDCGFEGDVSALVNEQRVDPTLECCWSQAAEGKGGFVTHRRLLYYKDQVDVVARVNGCAVINECDKDFGCVLTPSVVLSCVPPSQRIDVSKLSHLEAEQRRDLLQIIDEFQDCFADKPGFCDAAVHRIQTMSEFVPRQMRPYRVPDTETGSRSSNTRTVDIGAHSSIYESDVQSNRVCC